MKHCSKCQVEKEYSEFYKDKRKKDGVQSKCKKCSDAYTKAWKAKNPDKVKAQRQRYYAKPEKKLQRHQSRLKQYGITFEEKCEMLKAQGYKCAICSKEFNDTESFESCVDHCHATGKVRGLLCPHCNRALGLLKDSPDIIRRAADYVEENL